MTNPNVTAVDDKQAAQEERAKNIGLDRARALLTRTLGREAASETAGGLTILRRSIEPAAYAIAQYLVEAEAKRGRRPTLFRKAGHMDPELLAYLTAKVAIDRAIVGDTLLRTAQRIGAAVEDELRLAAFEAQAPGLYVTLERSLRERGSNPEHARVVWSTSAQKAGVEIPRWTRDETVHVGLQLFDIFHASTGLVERVLVTRKRNRVVWAVRLGAAAGDWFSASNDRALLARPSYLPTLVVPKDWTSIRGGGYFTDALDPLPLVRRTRPAHVEALRTADLSGVYGGLNAIQGTPWCINLPVLRVMQQAWEGNARLQCLPHGRDLTMPERPVDIETNEEARRAWRAAARKVHAENIKTRGSRLEFARLLSVAHDAAGNPAIYFPHNLDFRGRCYAVPPTLTPQGPDEARALLTFAGGKPVDGAAYWWLNVHGANVFGNDKVSMQARAQWGQEARERAVATAADPLADLWWTEADKPWSFLAWCFEVARTDGLSSLPIALDGSCNGLQHYSAMLRDPIGGAAVNLVPMDAPQDIYQRVADRVIERLREEVAAARRGERPLEEETFARGWLAFGIDRKITKRPVMVLPYGGTHRACLNYIRDAVRERLGAGQDNPFGSELARAELYLAGLVWRSIGDVVVAARAAMDWLQAVARVMSKAGRPVVWTAPSGFLAHQEYLRLKERQLETRLRGGIIKLVDWMEGERIDPHRQALAIAPNFVHSMDASALLMTAASCKAAGIEHFAMIHDSYGTLASDTDQLAGILRRVFVEMYEQHDVLANFAAEQAANLPEEMRHSLPPVPQKGALDLRAVLDSPYFFA